MGDDWSCVVARPCGCGAATHSDWDVAPTGAVMIDLKELDQGGMDPAHWCHGFG